MKHNCQIAYFEYCIETFLTNDFEAISNQFLIQFETPN